MRSEFLVNQHSMRNANNSQKHFSTLLLLGKYNNILSSWLNVDLVNGARPTDINMQNLQQIIKKNWQ